LCNCLCCFIQSAPVFHERRRFEGMERNLASKQGQAPVLLRWARVHVPPAEPRPGSVHLLRRFRQHTVPVELKQNQTSQALHLSRWGINWIGFALLICTKRRRHIFVKGWGYRSVMRLQRLGRIMKRGARSRREGRRPVSDISRCSRSDPNGSDHFPSVLPNILLEACAGLASKTFLLLSNLLSILIVRAFVQECKGVFGWYLAWLV